MTPVLTRDETIAVIELLRQFASTSTEWSACDKLYLSITTTTTPPPLVDITVTAATPTNHLLQ